ncbi:MAG: hypothetical protein IJD30_04900 [Clostridia bacterium]|nr:hypothetical protein [Clostridia bacterium]
MNPDSKLKDILGGIDKANLMKSKKTIEEFMNTQEGRNLASKLSEADKQRLLKAFMSMDSNTLKKQLSNADLSGLSAEKLSQIIKKLS